MLDKTSIKIWQNLLPLQSYIKFDQIANVKLITIFFKFEFVKSYICGHNGAIHGAFIQKNIQVYHHH